MSKEMLLTTTILALVALVCLIALVVILVWQYTRVRRLLVKHIYFALADIVHELENGEAPAHSPQLQRLLIALHAKCDNATYMTSLQYHPSENFRLLADQIGQEKYTPEALKQMTAELRELRKQLSDAAGLKPRRDISYKELGKLLQGFLDKWVHQYS